MILVDVNLLLYATFDDFPQHRTAREWFDARLTGTQQVGLPWGTLLGFLRLSTQTRMFRQPLSMDAACRHVDAWLGCSPVWIPAPGGRHAEILGELLRQSSAYSNLVPDAHLAAIAIEHGLTLCSTDTDFARWPRLHWENPIGA